MNNININTGVKRITINEDPERVIEFNPSDVAFAERFYQLIGEFEAKQVEYEKRAEELDAQDELDTNGLPANAGKKLAFMREVCEFMYQRIDFLFGEGTSHKAFGDVLSLEGIGQLFDGLVPFVKVSREQKVAKYVSASKGKRVMK